MIPASESKKIIPSGYTLIDDIPEQDLGETVVV